MKYLKNFNSISEGAFIDSTGNVALTANDDPNNDNEVLKSSSRDTSQFLGTPVALKKWPNLAYPIFSGLGVDDYVGKLDHPGRFKYTMDLLKKGAITNGDAALIDFMKDSFDKLGITRGFAPNYVVLTGSTSGLVGMMADAITNIFQDRQVKVINLPKIEYLNAGDAIDWEELASQVDKQSLKTLDAFKSNILNYIDRAQTNSTLLEFIKNSDSVAELRRLIMGVGRYSSPDTSIVWKEEINQEKMIPFLVRSSGRNFGGVRKFFKSKYDFQTEEFIEAAVDCLDARNPKRMLIIDDNKNTGTDLRTMKDNLDEIIANYPSQIKNPTTRFGFYVLYRMKPNSGFKYPTPMDAATSQDFRDTVLNKNNNDTNA